MTFNDILWGWLGSSSNRQGFGSVEKQKKTRAIFLTVNYNIIVCFVYFVERCGGFWHFGRAGMRNIQKMAIISI
jgi:hypothetical protein